MSKPILYTGILCLIVGIELAITKAAPQSDLKDLENLLQVLKENCVKKSKISKNLLANIKNGIFEDDAKSKAYVACNWLDSTVIDEQGNLNVDLVDQILPPSKKPQLSNLIIRCHKAQPSKKSICRRYYIRNGKMYIP
uniref:General odorant-binding protein 72-like isoform X2 n=1 Tax=Diabrotica virgifera virgifera TaxID=50390 RepID=A0A6P7FQJ1_DIAVI